MSFVYSFFWCFLMTQYIIVEGPDCVGKGYFIDQFKQFMKRPLNTPFDETDLETRDPDLFETLKEARWVAESGQTTGVFQTMEEATRFIKDTTTFIPVTQPLSMAVAEIPNATPENKEFSRKIHAGEMTQDQIAEEYLQVIYDHFNYAKLLGQTHDIVLMDRSLPSYYAYQIATMGYADKLPYWEQLHEMMTGEVNFIVIHLDAPVEVLAERKAKKKGVSVLDEIFFERIDKIRAGYAECYARKYFPHQIKVDATVTGEHPYDPLFRSLMLNLINATAPK